MIDIVIEHDGELNPIEIKKTSNPGSELIKVFGLLDRSSTPREKGAVLCMKPEQKKRGENRGMPKAEPLQPA